MNPAARNRDALAATLARFGCCDAGDAPAIVEALLHRGHARTASNHTVRMVLFASRGERAPSGWHWVHLDHVFRYLDDFLRIERGALGGTELHDPALSWLALIHKCDLTLHSSSGHES